MSAYQDAIQEYTDDRRHYLVTESYDWEKLGPAIAEWMMLVPPYMQHSGDMAGALNTLMVLVETAYVMGYERGQNESTNL